LSIERDLDDNMLYISSYKDMFSVKQYGILQVIKQRFVDIWRIIRGKEYYLFDICVEKDEAEKVLSELRKL
jgi:hypothetical protein